MVDYEFGKRKKPSETANVPVAPASGAPAGPPPPVTEPPKVAPPPATAAAVAAVKSEPALESRRVESRPAPPPEPEAPAMTAEPAPAGEPLGPPVPFAPAPGDEWYERIQTETTVKLGGFAQRLQEYLAHAQPTVETPYWQGGTPWRALCDHLHSEIAELARSWEGLVYVVSGEFKAGKSWTISKLYHPGLMRDKTSHTLRYQIIDSRATPCTSRPTRYRFSSKLPGQWWGNYSDDNLPDTTSGQKKDKVWYLDEAAWVPTEVADTAPGDIERLAGRWQLQPQRPRELTLGGLRQEVEMLDLPGYQPDEIEPPAAVERGGKKLDSWPKGAPWAPIYRAYFLDRLFPCYWLGWKEVDGQLGALREASCQGSGSPQAEPDPPPIEIADRAPDAVLVMVPSNVKGVLVRVGSGAAPEGYLLLARFLRTCEFVLPEANLWYVLNIWSEDPAGNKPPVNVAHRAAQTQVAVDPTRATEAIKRLVAGLAPENRAKTLMALGTIMLHPVAEEQAEQNKQWTVAEKILARLRQAELPTGIRMERSELLVHCTDLIGSVDLVLFAKAIRTPVIAEGLAVRWQQDRVAPTRPAPRFLTCSGTDRQMDFDNDQCLPMPAHLFGADYLRSVLNLQPTDRNNLSGELQVDERKGWIRDVEKTIADGVTDLALKRQTLELHDETLRHHGYDALVAPGVLDTFRDSIIDTRRSFVRLWLAQRLQEFWFGVRPLFARPAIVEMIRAGLIWTGAGAATGPRNELPDGTMDNVPTGSKVDDAWETHRQEVEKLVKQFVESIGH